MMIQIILEQVKKKLREASTATVFYITISTFIVIYIMYSEKVMISC